MDVAARTLILIGAAIVLAGLVLWLGARLGLGRLPGDIVVERDNIRLFFPIVTMLVLSLILTIVLNIAFRIFR